MAAAVQGNRIARAGTAADVMKIAGQNAQVIEDWSGFRRAADHSA
jgi:hypothetical protein